ncbi:MAG: HD-GYP domain-containing protein [Pirellulales bacterium]
MLQTPSAIAKEVRVSRESGAATDAVAETKEITRVLVADGNSTVRKILRHNFTTLGWEIIEAKDGEETLRLANSDRAPHAILLELNLAKIDGYEICRRLKADIQSRLIPIVALTSLDNREDTARALDAGADEFLTKPINRAELTVRLRSLVRMHRFNQELIGAESVAMALARAVASKDGYSNGHVEQVANYAVMLGEAIGLDPADLKIVRYGAILHNVGKIAIPDTVLEKTGPLTPREKALFQQHPRVGCDICAPLKPLRPILPIIRHHKEHWDGTGFPDALRGDEIPVGAQIVGVVDVYSALTTDRPFRQAMKHEEAIETLRDRSRLGLHDTKLAEAFINALEKRLPKSADVESGESLETKK